MFSSGILDLPKNSRKSSASPSACRNVLESPTLISSLPTKAIDPAVIIPAQDTIYRDIGIKTSRNVWYPSFLGIGEHKKQNPLQGIH